jgi:hypothetical protein
VALGRAERSDGEEGLPLRLAKGGGSARALQGSWMDWVARTRGEDSVMVSPAGTFAPQTPLAGDLIGGGQVSSARSFNKYIRATHSFPEKCPVSISHPTMLPSTPNLTIVLQDRRRCQFNLASLEPRYRALLSCDITGRGAEFTSRK